MPANDRSSIQTGTPVKARAAYSYSKQDAIAFLTQIPGGGCTLTLPLGEAPAEEYDFADVDGTCSAGNPITIAGQAGQLIQGLASLAVTSPFAWGRLVWSGSAWALESGGGTGGAPAAILEPNIAALGALPAAALQDGTQATVQSNGSLWVLLKPSALTPDGITIINANGGGQWIRSLTLIAAQAQAQLVWNVDKQNVSGTASDENTGLTSGTALRTVAEIMRRLGTWSANYDAVAVQINYLSGDTGPTDPSLFNPNLMNGASLTETAPLPAPGWTGTLLAVTAKNAPTNQALNATITTVTGALAVGMLLVNTFAGRGLSCAWATRNNAGTWIISQPFAPYAGGGALALATAQNNAWANGDTISGYVLPSVNIQRVQSEGVIAGGPLRGGHIVWRLALTNFSQATNLDVGGLFSALIESSVIAGMDLISNPTGGVQINNCSLSCFVQANSGTNIVGGQSLNANMQLNGIVSIGNDFVSSPNAGGQGIQFCGSSTGLGGAVVTAIYYDTNPTLPNKATGTVYVRGPQYGAGTLNASGATVNHAGATAVARYPLTGGLQLDGVATGYSLKTTAGVTAVAGTIALTAANIDAAAGPGGFGGTATNLAGSSFTNGNQN